MKISISKKDLNEAFKGFSKVAAKKPAVPMLSVLKISSDRNGVRITTTNLDEWLTYKINDGSYTDCSFMINIHEFKEFISQTKSADSYEFTVIDESHVRVSADINDYPKKVFKTLPIDEWAKMPSISKNIAQVSAQVFKYIKQAIPSASKDDTRTALKSILLEPESVVATNGKELVQFQCKTGIKRSVPIPVTKFLLSGKLAENGGNISIDNINGREYCVLVTEHWEYAVNTVISIYPDYKQVIPDKSSSSIQISTDDIEYLQKAIPLLESTSEHNTIHLYANSDEITILSENLKSSVLKATGVYRGLGSSQPVVISMNRKFLLRALSLGFNKFSFNTGYSPITASSDTENSLMVFMPLKGNVPIEKIAEKVAKKVSVYNHTHSPNTGIPQQKKQAIDCQKEPKTKQVSQKQNKTFTEKEVKMSESKSNLRPPVFKPANNTESDPMNELMESITILKIKARDVIELATDLSKKVKEIQKSKKIQEREFKSTRELLVKLQKVSGF